MTSMDLDRWTRVKDRLRAEVGDDVYASWFARMELDSSEGDTVKLSVPTRFLKSWIQSHYAERVAGLLAGRTAEFLTGRAHRPLRGDPHPAAKDQAGRDCCASTREPRGQAQRRPPAPYGWADFGRARGFGGSPLDPRLTFETFVIGRSNTLAHAAAKQVAQGRRGDVVMFNPLYVTRASGSARRTCCNRWHGLATPPPSARCCISPRRVHVRFCRGVAAQNALAFKEALRTIDVLVIDDLQFLQGRSTQAEFCHTLNALIDAGRQVVIAADRPPSISKAWTSVCGHDSPAGSWSKWDRSARSYGSKSSVPRRGRQTASSRIRCSAPGAGVSSQKL